MAARIGKEFITVMVRRWFGDRGISGAGNFNRCWVRRGPGVMSQTVVEEF